MPLAEAERAIAVRAEQLGDGDLVGRQALPLERRHVLLAIGVVHWRPERVAIHVRDQPHERLRRRRELEAEAGGVAPGHDRGARRRAGGVARVAARELDAVSGERIDVGCRDGALRDAPAAEREIVVAEVVGDDDDDVRRPAGGGLGGIRRSRGPLDRPIRSHRVAPAREGAGHVEQDEIERGPRPDREHHEDARDAEEPPTHRTTPRSPCPRARRRRRHGRSAQVAHGPRAATRDTSLDTGTASAPTAGRRPDTRPARRRARARRHSPGGTARRRARPRPGAAAGGSPLPRAKPILVGRLEPRQVLDEVDPGDDARRRRQGERAWRGIEPGELRQLTVEGEVARAGAPAHHEAGTGETRIEQCEQAPVAILDHRGGGGVRADDAEAADLPLGELLACLGRDLVLPVDQHPARQERRGVLHVGGVGPAIVEHRLGEPFVGVVLDERVEEREHRVGRNHRAPGVRLLQPAGERARIDLGDVGTGDHELRQQLDAGARQRAMLGRIEHHPRVRNPPIAQHRAKLPAVRRAGHPDDSQPAVRRHGRAVEAVSAGGTRRACRSARRAIGDHAESALAELAQGRVALVVARAARPIPRLGQEPLAAHAVPEERVERDLDRAPPARPSLDHRTEAGQHVVLDAMAAVERGGEGGAANEPPTGRAGVGGGERLRVDRPLVAQHVADAGVDLGVEPAGQTAREGQHGERAVGIARHAQDEELAVGAGTLEVGAREGDARDAPSLVVRQDGEGIVAERALELGRSEHARAEHGRRVREPFDGRSHDDLPPDLEHLSVGRRMPDGQTMSSRLVRHRAQEDVGDGGHSAAAADGGAHVHLVVVQEAQVEAAVRGEAHAIARAAVGLGDRTDEADHAACTGGPIVARLVRRIVRLEGLEHAEHVLDPAAELRRRHEPIARRPRGVAAAERHGLDEADVPRPIERQRGERDDVVLVEGADDHGVQLDRREAGRVGRLEARPDVGQRPPAHDPREPLGIEAVEVHVQPAEPRAAERLRQLRQQDAVGREGEIAEAGQRREPADDVEQVGAQRRLPAGEADLPEPDRDRRGRHQLDLVGGEQRLGRQEASPEVGMQYTHRRLQWSVSEMRR